MTPAEFKRQLDKLETVIKDGIAYFTVWRGLRRDEDSVRAVNSYRWFFFPAHNALISTALIQFNKVFESDRRTVSLRNLLGAAKKDRAHLTPHATEEDLNQIEQQLDANEALLKRLKRVRDQLLVHTAIKPGYKSLHYGEMERLVEDIKASYNSLRHGHDRRRFMFENWSREHERATSEVVRIMREERDRAIRRSKEAARKTRS